ncbi:DUF4861 domain-containing protein [Parabacteroides sp. Marseille-P3160]|uniref:DUF4861 domain-containing protein n=1 Tax=Parabacteroides sp. Marseille-P3160 TaxID=1917887 RepID=UPI0009BA0682|nr:DUF4861 domain-containing protein [Parabacteroides sp. Marseille-P3160]
MKKLIYFAFAALLFASCTKASKEVKITIANPSDFDRTEELTAIPLDSLSNKLALTDSQVYVVKNSAGEVVPSQVTFDRTLIFPSGVKANETATYAISAGTYQEFPAKTYARFIKERKDDFAWENDRVAFRIYGPALVEIDGPSNGIDLWYKRTNNLIIDKWYKDDLAKVASYHEDRGEGLDDYKVGRTLGAGAMAPFVNGKLWLNENFASQELLENGPLRTTFKLTYNSFDVNGKSISEIRIFSLDAGSQLTKVTEQLGVSEPTPVAAGIVKREKNDSILVSPEKDYIVYLEPGEKAGSVFVGLVFPTPVDSTVINTYEVLNPISKKKETHTHILGLTTYQPNKPVTYYTGYGWEKFGFPTIADFQKHVANFSKALKQPLIVTFN